MPNVNIGDLAATVVAQNPELRSQLTDLMSTIISHMQYTMLYGSNADRTTLAKSITPQLLKGMHSAQAAEGDKEMKEAYKALIADLTGGRSTEIGSDE